MRWRLQKLQHSQSTMSVGRSSSNGNTGTARLAAPRLLPRAPDSMFESFSEYGGMTLNSSLPSSSCCCSSCSLSSICKKKGKERVILPINRRGGAWREVRYVNVRGKIGQNSQQNLKAHEDISCGEETTRRLNCYIKTCCNSLTAFQSIKVFVSLCLKQKHLILNYILFILVKRGDAPWEWKHEVFIMLIKRYYQHKGSLLMPYFSFFLNYPDLEVWMKSNHVSLWPRKQEPHNNHNNNSIGRSPRSRSTLLGSQPICPPEIRQDECGMRFAANRNTNKTHSVKTLPVCIEQKWPLPSDLCPSTHTHAL